MKSFVCAIAAAIMLLSASVAAAENYIEAEGIVYAESGMSPNLMHRAAVMNAYRYLAEQIDTLHVTSTSTVKNLRDMDDQINTKVEAALHGAKVISVTRDGDGSFHAIVRLPMFGSTQSLAGAVLKEDVKVEDFPKPKFTSIRTEVHYTGLIIDCRGLNLSEAVTPAIKSVGGVEVYAYNNVGYQSAVSKGMVEYANNLESPRAGSTPLVIKAVKISGSCDVVVSDEDANKILQANQIANILVNCAVVLVR